MPGDLRVYSSKIIRRGRIPTPMLGSESEVSARKQA